MNQKSKRLFTELYNLHDKYDKDPQHKICAEAAEHIKTLDEENSTTKDKGRTVSFPCKIGDKIYEIENKSIIMSFYVIGFVLGKTQSEEKEDVEHRQGWQIEYGKFGIECESPIKEFGKSLFLTREAAEQALDTYKNNN